MPTGKRTTIVQVTFVTLLILIFAGLVRSAMALFQGSTGTGTTSGFTFDPISFLIGAGVGALVVGILFLIRPKHTNPPAELSIMKRKEPADLNIMKRKEPDQKTA